METRIETKEFDTANSSCNGSFGYGVYMYFMDEVIATADDSGFNHYVNTMPFSQAYSTVSVVFSPYLNSNELQLYKIPYDNEYFKWQLNGAVSGIDKDAKPYVYRIAGVVDSTDGAGVVRKRLGTFKCYKPNKSIGGARSWVNESKLYQYPYRFAYLTDGIMQPIEIKYHLCKDNDVEVYSRSAININADYSIYLRNYKEDADGLLEQFIASGTREFPCVSSQYSQYLATNKNQVQTSVNQSYTSGLLGGLMTGAGLGAGAGSIIPGLGNVAGAVGGAVIGGVLGMVHQGAQAEERALAQEKDSRNLPNSLVSKGADPILGLYTNDFKLKLVRYTQREEYMRKMGDFFAKYGYIQNKIMKPKLRGRYYYTYIKTTESIIKANKSMPKAHFDTIKGIIDRGVTVWSIDRPNVIVGDYSKDNYEV